jgi:tripartite-type tricarboxylate transporter receptor subunit TctC
MADCATLNRRTFLKENAMALARRRFLVLAGGAVAAPVIMRRGWAYPERPVRMIVPLSAGGPTDVFARLIAQKLSDSLGKQFYVENIPGAGGNIGIGRAAQAAPDGYTIMVVASSYVVNPSLYATIPYDPHKDFEPITIAVANVVGLSVNPSVPAQTVDELIALIKASPGKYSYASAGTGQASHLVGETFRLTLGLDLVHVPFNGSGPAIASMVAGHTPIGFTSSATAAPQVKDGRLRALAVMNRTRLPVLPDVPTMAEAGHGDIECDDWLALLAPAGTPREIVELIHREVANIIAQPSMKEQLAALGFQPIGNTPEEFAAQIRTDIAKRAKIIAAAGIRAQ